VNRLAAWLRIDTGVAGMVNAGRLQAVTEEADWGCLLDRCWLCSQTMQARSASPRPTHARRDPTSNARLTLNSKPKPRPAGGRWCARTNFIRMCRGQEEKGERGDNPETNADRQKRAEQVNAATMNLEESCDETSDVQAHEPQDCLQLDDGPWKITCRASKCPGKQGERRERV
jgi:hypothetical protein